MKMILTRFDVADCLFDREIRSPVNDTRVTACLIIAWHPSYVFRSFNVRTHNIANIYRYMLICVDRWIDGGSEACIYSQQNHNEGQTVFNEALHVWTITKRDSYRPWFEFPFRRNLLSYISRRLRPRWLIINVKFFFSLISTQKKKFIGAKNILHFKLKTKIFLGVSKNVLS